MVGMTTKKGRQLFCGKKCNPPRRENPGYTYAFAAKSNKPLLFVCYTALFG